MDNGKTINSKIASTSTTVPTPISTTAAGSCPMENVTTTFQSLDTVRALHHTVVSLRSALEEAKFEIQRLRSQITTETEIKDGVKLNQQPKQEKQRTDNSQKTIRFQTNLNCNKNNKKQVKKEESNQSIKFDIPEIQATSTPRNIGSDSNRRSSARKTKIIPDISIVTTPRYCPSTEIDNSCSDRNKMASKIDVKIKVTSNINVNDNSDNDDSNSINQTNVTGNEKIDDQQKNMNNDDPDEYRKDFKFSTEENLSIRKNKNGEYILSQSSKENLHLPSDYDDNSDGDNSVFETSNEMQSIDKPSSSNNETKEECDDIELIFSSDNQHHRDPIQEEMISLSEFDPWQEAGSSGTPVLVKFSSITSEKDSSINTVDELNNSCRSNNVIRKLPTSSTSCDTFSTRNFHHNHQDKSLESNGSFDNNLKLSNLDKENNCGDYDGDDQKNIKFISRDESLDFFDNSNDGSMGRKWTNYNVLVETDISKCGIVEETAFELYQRRNTCPNPPAYRPILPRDPHIITRHIPSRLASKFCRRIQYNPACNASSHYGNNTQNFNKGPKRSSSAQTEISALPEYWKSECQLAGNRYFIGGPCTLPSKFVPISKKGPKQHMIGISERTQEARRVLLSDINFTSMLPELSRSAEYLDEDRQDDKQTLQQHQQQQQTSGYYKGNLLKTPDYVIKGMTPSVSMTSPGLSQWTVNENSFGTQTIQTGDSWGGKRGDSLDSCRSYSIGSRASDLNRHHRSRSVPSVRCAICKQNRTGGIRISESMHYTPRVTFQEPSSKIRGSLPDLRQDCMCTRRLQGRTILTIHGDSSGSTESLLDEAEAFVRKSLDGANFKENCNVKRPNLRRMSENDIQRDYIPSKQSLPFLPKTPNCLKSGHLAKVITKSGRVVVGRVRYVGPLIIQGKIPTNYDGCNNNILDDLYVGIQLQSKCGDCDGTFDGRKFFDCEPLQGVFVPFKKVIMAWTG